MLPVAKETKLKETKLKETSNRIPGVIYQFMVGADGEWSFPFISEGVRELFGVTPEEALADVTCMNSCIHPEDREEHRLSVLSATKNLEEWFSEHRIITTDGKTKWVQGRAAPRRLSGGAVLWNGILLDVTLLKMAEERLREREERYRKDFMIAEKMQRTLLPNPDSFAGQNLAEIKCVYAPYHHVSGDSFNWIWNADESLLYITLIDVMGHGVAAALQTAAVRGLFRQVVDIDISMQDKLTWINERVPDYFAEDAFAAVSLIRVCFKTKVLRYITGGINSFLALKHNRLIHVKAAGSYVGLSNDTCFEEVCLSFDTGDSFIFATDGLLELLPSDIEADSFDNLVRRFEELVSFPGRHDDATAVCLRIK